MQRNTTINIIIALLQEIEIDGETMEHIINEVGMRNQMISQLAVESKIDVEELTSAVTDAILDNSINLINDYILDLRNREIELVDVTLDERWVEQIVKEAIEKHINA